MSRSHDYVSVSSDDDEDSDAPMLPVDETELEDAEREDEPNLGVSSESEASAEAVDEENDEDRTLSDDEDESDDERRELNERVRFQQPELDELPSEDLPTPPSITEMSEDRRDDGDSVTVPVNDSAVSLAVVSDSEPLDSQLPFAPPGPSVPSPPPATPHAEPLPQLVAPPPAADSLPVSALSRAELESALLATINTTPQSEIVLRIATLELSLSSARQSHAALMAKCRESESRCSLLRSENSLLIDQVRRSNTMIDELQRERRALDEERRVLMRSQSVARSSDSSVDSELRACEVRAASFEREKELLVARNKLLNAEINEKSLELLSTRKQFAAERARLESDITRTKTELDTMTAMTEAVRSNAAIDASSRTNFDAEVSTLLAQHRSTVLTLQHELADATRLKNNYAQAREEERSRAELALRRVSELEERIVRESVHFQERLARKESEVQSLKDRLTQCELDVETRNKEKTSLLAVIDEHRHANPWLALPNGTDSSLPQSPQSTVTVTSTTHSATLSLNTAELYSRLAQANEAVRAERDKAVKLSKELRASQLDVQEIRNMFTQQQKEQQVLERAQGEMTADIERLKQSITDYQRQQSRMQQEMKCAKELAARSQQEAHDTARQLRATLKRERERRQSLSHSERALLPAGNDSGAPMSQSDISATLVEFADTDELQAQNARILAALRAATNELSELKEQQAHALTADQSHERQLKEARELISELQNDRQRVESRLAVIVSQSSGANNEPDAHTVSRVRDLESRVSELTSDLSLSINDRALLDTQVRQAQERFGAYQREATAALTAVQESHNQTREALDESRTKLAQAQLEVRQLRDRIDAAERTSERSSTEAFEAGRRLRELQSTLTARDSEVADSRARFESLEDARRRETQSLASLHEELAILRDREARFREDERRHRDELTRQSTVIETLQQAQRHTEDTQSQRSAHLESQFETVKQSLADTQYELNTVRSTSARLTAERDEARTRVSSLETDIVRMSASLSSMTADLAVQRDRVRAAEAQVQERRAELEAFHVSSERERAKLSGSTINWFKQQEEFEVKIQQLQSAIEASETEKAELALTVEAKQRAVREIQDRAEAERIAMEARIAALAQANEAAETSLRTCQASLRNAIAERSRLEEEAERLQQTVSALTSTNQSLTGSVTELESRVVTLRQQCAAYQSQYEQELSAHAQSMAETAELKENIARLLTDSDELRAALSAATMRAAEQEREKTCVKAELEAVQTSHVSLVQSKDRQLELLYAQLADQQSVASDAEVSMAGSDTSLTDDFTEGDAIAARPSDGRATAELSQLRELIPLLRSERAGSEAECERLRQEAARLNAQLAAEQEAKARVEQERDAIRSRAAIAASAKPSTHDTAQLTQLESQLTEHQSNINSMKIELAARTARVEALESTIRALEKEVERWQQRQHKRANNENNTISGHDSQLAARLTHSAAAARFWRVKFQSLESTAATIKAGVTDVKALEVRLIRAVSIIKAKDSQLQSVRGSSQRCQQEVAELSEQLERAKVTIAELESQPLRHGEGELHQTVDSDEEELDTGAGFKEDEEAEAEAEGTNETSASHDLSDESETAMTDDEEADESESDHALEAGE